MIYNSYIILHNSYNLRIIRVLKFLHSSLDCYTYRHTLQIELSHVFTYLRKNVENISPLIFLFLQTEKIFSRLVFNCLSSEKKNKERNNHGREKKKNANYMF